MNKKSHNAYEILKKHEFEPEHAEQIKKLSLLIFDKTKGALHNFAEREREFLEVGALLHDIGYSIAREEHNKHSYTLIIRHLTGFSSEETEIIANIAKFHRGKRPKKDYDEFLDLKSFDIAKKLGAIVRIADGLDRSHISMVQDIDCIYDSFAGILYIILKLNVPGCKLDIGILDKKKDLFEKSFKVFVKFKIDKEIS